MSRTGSNTSIVCGRNHSTYFPVQLPINTTMTWTHGVGHFAYYVALHEVSGVDAGTGNVQGTGVDITRELAIFAGGLPLSQPDVNTLVITNVVQEGFTAMFILEVKWRPNSQEADLTSVDLATGINDDPRIVIA